MEKINKRKLENIPTLQKLHDNWERWGQDYKIFLDSGSPKKQKGVKKVGQDFSWRENIYDELRTQIQIYDGKSHRDNHCCFCDGYPIGENSTETIEHFHPKVQYPLKAYDWDNLFYCCNKCQSEANKMPFTFTIMPSDANYLFEG
jgi:5-methylcytosine-specific restriction endonuclease McrA